MNRHLQMVDAVNNAVTAQQHRSAEHQLRGYRRALDDLGYGWSGVEADLHTMEQHGEDRLVCCGVLLDWIPKESAL